MATAHTTSATQDNTNTFNTLSGAATAGKGLLKLTFGGVCFGAAYALTPVLPNPYMSLAAAGVGLVSAADGLKDIYKGVEEIIKSGQQKPAGYKNTSILELVLKG